MFSFRHGAATIDFLVVQISSNSDRIATVIEHLEVTILEEPADENSCRNKKCDDDGKCHA